MTMFWAMALKGFVALAFFSVAYVISRILAKIIPNGRVKDVLFDRTLQARHPWKVFFLFTLFFFGAMALGIVLGSLRA